MPQKKRALLYGINNYYHEDVPDLRGCVNDVKNISKLLKESFGFPASAIRGRTDKEVVLKTIVDDWKWLVRDAQPGDQLVFHFSGHGSQVANEQDDDIESDGLDEILCLYDMDFNDPETYLLDDTIGEWIDKLKPGVKLTFLLDCCHSGTGTRSLSPKFDAYNRSLRSFPLVMTRETDTRKKNMGTRAFGDHETPEDESLVVARYLVPPGNVLRSVESRSAKRQAEQHRRTTNSKSTVQQNHVRFSGCHDEQTSADAFIEGQFQGAFSSFFRKAVEEDQRIGHDDLIIRIREMLDAANFTQTPQLFPPGITTSVLDGLDDPRISQPEPGTTHDDTDSTADLRRQIRKLTSEVERLNKLLSADSPTEARKKRTKNSTSSSQTVIVYVHGNLPAPEGIL